MRLFLFLYLSLNRCLLVDIYCSFGVPYMIYDIGAMYIVHREEKKLNNAPTRKAIASFLSKQWVLVSHHLVLAAVFYPFVMVRRDLIVYQSVSCVNLLFLCIKLFLCVYVCLFVYFCCCLFIKKEFIDFYLLID